MDDEINSPKHYKLGTKYEVLDVIEGWHLNFHLGNTLKYVSRSGRKGIGNEIKDLKKSIFYVERFLNKSNFVEVDGFKFIKISPTIDELFTDWGLNLDDNNFNITNIYKNLIISNIYDYAAMRTEIENGLHIDVHCINHKYTLELIIENTKKYISALEQVE